MIRAEKAIKFLVSCFAFFVLLNFSKYAFIVEFFRFEFFILLNFLYERWIDTNEKEAIRNPFTR